MKVINTVKDMQTTANEIRELGKKISYVPTMGALHDGHLKLISEARKIADVLVVSIFVNPTQFGTNEDLSKYPRDWERDLKKIRPLGVDLVFNPSAEEIYSPGFQTYVEVKELEEHLCGSFRPGHFRGVATVVLKLFNIIKPHFAFFGEKDYQQLKIIRRMVKDLNLEVDIIEFPTVRGKEGLALSSRNSYLSPAEREKAVFIPRALFEVKREFQCGVKDPKKITEVGIKILKQAGIDDIDYLEICDPETLERKASAEAGDLAAVAVRLGGARLIDNTKL